MIGPEVPEAIQKIRNERLGRLTKKVQDQSSDDSDFAGPSLGDYKNEEDFNEEEELGRKRLQKSQNTKEGDFKLNENDLKHESWMSMKPEWAVNASGSKPNSKTQTSSQAQQPSESNRPSLLEQHREKRKLEGLDDKNSVKYDSSESLNAEIRKEVFRKASNLNDRFTRGS